MATIPLPRWDLSPYFPSPDSRPFTDAHERLTADLDRLGSLFERHDVRGGDPRPPTPADLAACDEVLSATNDLLARVRLVGAYLHALVTTDATDDLAAGLMSQFQSDVSGLTALTKRFEAWIGRLGAESLIAGSEQAAAHGYPIARMEQAAEHQLTEAEEGLAAELRLTGSNAWARLHRDVTARLMAEVEQGGVIEPLPMSVVRGLASHADPAVRRSAFDGEQVAWESVAVALAAALNGAKGEHEVLNRRRGWPDALEPALFHNGVDRSTLDAMTDAVVDSLPVFRRYLRAKAAWLGHPGGLPWWDLLAPVSVEPARDWSWDAATSHVGAAFGGYSSSLAALLDRAVHERWIDAEPREGKAGGAYCLPVRDGESRVFLNHSPSFDSVQTLAHELGHAYHNTQLGERTPMQRQTPMALAETASIFCETVVVQAGLASASETERLTLLDVDLQGATQVVVDIHSRFRFEQELCLRRARRTLGVAELCELMLEAQDAAYGEGLDPDTRHRWMWAVKGHYFTPFYNWPYTFGLLFGIGLYARYVDDPERFRAGYDDLLSSTGLGDAASLAARFDIDIRSSLFWQSSLDVLGARIDEFCELAGRHPAPTTERVG